ncbi:MAG: hypothetical protein JSV49_11230, partial [Thermoplasmata archaeon]
KHLYILIIILILLIPAILFIYNGPKEPERGKEAPSEVWVNRLNNANSLRTEYLTERALVISFNGQSSAELSVATSAAAVYRTGSDVLYNPLIIKDGDEDALPRYFELSERSQEDLVTSDVMESSIELAKLCWQKSDFIILYADYQNGLAAVPLASYYNIPMVYINGSASPLNGLIAELECKYAISLENAPLPDIPTMGIGYDTPVSLNEFFLWCLQSNGDSSDYVVLTNPNDIYNTWGEADKIPLAGVSTTAGQVAAYRSAMIYFADGYDQSELGVNFDDYDNYNQMGAEVAVANAYADRIKQLVNTSKNLTEQYGGSLKYLCIVGDPIGMPFHYEFFEPGGSGTTFANTNFAASDYYFSDIEGDEKQDLVYGRILGRSVTDTSLLCVRNLGFAEYSEYAFEKGNDVSERFYDTFSEDWTQNAGVFVGTSKPFPLPGALKHMKKYHYDVLSSSGMFVTGEEALRLNDVTAAEMLDKMNYLMYCGHGNQFSWYSNRADYIDASFVATQKLKPGFAAVMACQTSRTDNLDDTNNNKISLAYIHAGLSGYIGASRLAYGLFKVGDGEQGMLLDTGALYLVDRITNHFTEGTYSTGELLLLARNELMDKFDIHGDSSESFEAKVTVWEYLLYGDPAWMPVY